MKLITIVGARPQFIKAATVSRALRTHSPDIQEILVHTGQHFDSNMSKIFFDELKIAKPNYNLGLGGGSHGQNTGRMLEKIESVLLKETPDRILVYGDTNTTLAGALAASKLHIPVAHVEAGLRSFNRKMPEEINRLLTDHIADMLFVPTEAAVKHLRDEGISETCIHLVGDVMYDTALFYRDRSRKPAWFEALDFTPGDFVLCTLHRAENTDDPDRLKSIFNGLADSHCPILMPLHPRTRKRMHNFGINIARNIHLVDPVGYLEMVWLESNCSLVVTDSGGVQKEAYFHGKFCITLREETEWMELVDAGWNQLLPPLHPHFASTIRDAIGAHGSDVSLYGDGNAAIRIVAEIRK